jgi:hypothetical protein
VAARATEWSWPCAAASFLVDDSDRAIAMLEIAIVIGTPPAEIPSTADFSNA